jgi:predicted RNA-binding Zn-ribbon protein involved in translation (DUF1610 family)
MRKSFQFRIYPTKKQAELNRLKQSFDMYQLINLTKYKAEYSGKIVELVNPKGTSQTCICGHHVPKDLSVRVHSCPSCGLVLNREPMKRDAQALLELGSSLDGGVVLTMRLCMSFKMFPFKRTANTTVLNLQACIYMMTTITWN